MSDTKWHRYLSTYDLERIALHRRWKERGALSESDLDDSPLNNLASVSSYDSWYKAHWDVSHEFDARCPQSDLDDLNGGDGYWTKFRYAVSQSDWLWHKIGRPQWYVDDKVFELLESCTIDENLTGINFSHDTFVIVFQHGQLIRGVPIFAIKMSFIRSDLGKSMIQKMFGALDSRISDYIICEATLGIYGAMIDGKLVCTTDSNVAMNYQMSKFASPIPNVSESAGTKFHLMRSPPEDDSSTGGAISRYAYVDEAKTKLVLRDALKIGCAAMLYRDARPDLIIPYTLPRSQRYGVPGDRSSIQRAMLPSIKYVRDGISSTPEVPSHTKSPHYRGFVLRVLRNQKYKRKPDGSFRTILVPPCAIHPELMDEAQELLAT